MPRSRHDDHRKWKPGPVCNCSLDTLTHPTSAAIAVPLAIGADHRARWSYTALISVVLVLLFLANIVDVSTVVSV